MSQRPVISVLLVEDNPGDARLVRELLLEASLANCSATWVKCLCEAEEQLDQNKFDAVLLDLSLPDSQGIETIRQVRKRTQAPIVVLTGQSDSEVGLMAVKEGCQDYLVKGEGDGDLIARTLLFAIERERIQDALERSEERFRELVEISPDAILIYAGDGIVFANPAAVSLLKAKDRESLVGARLRDLFTGEAGPDLMGVIRGVLDSHLDQVDQTECSMTALDGSIFDAEVSVVLMDYLGLTAVQIIVRDIGTRKDVERSHRLASTVFQTSGEAMMVTDANLKIVAVNPAFTDTTGYLSEEALGLSPRMLSSGRHSPRFYEEIWRSIKADGHWRGELWNRRKNGEIYVQRATISAIADESGKATNYVCVFADITDEKQVVEEAQFHATHDALTGLPNRMLLSDRIEHALKNAARDHEMIAVLFVDLDKFKPINDRLGHLAGDHVLQWVADRLQHSVREGDTVARIGGDEFVVVAMLAHEREDAEKVSTKILESISESFVLDGSTIELGCSIGIAIFPEHGLTGDELVECADEAMYAAKRAGKGRYHFFVPHNALALAVS